MQRLTMRPLNDGGLPWMLDAGTFRGAANPIRLSGRSGTPDFHIRMAKVPGKAGLFIVSPREMDDKSGNDDPQRCGNRVARRRD